MWGSRAGVNLSHYDYYLFLFSWFVGVRAQRKDGSEIGGGRTGAAGKRYERKERDHFENADGVEARIGSIQ